MKCRTHTPHTHTPHTPHTPTPLHTHTLPTHTHTPHTHTHTHFPRTLPPTHAQREEAVHAFREELKEVELTEREVERNEERQRLAEEKTQLYKVCTLTAIMTEIITDHSLHTWVNWRAPYCT